MSGVMATVITPSAIDQFRAIVGPEDVLAEPLERLLYAKDGSMNQGQCGLAVLCESTAEVAACVRLAAELGLPVVPRGSGTSLAGSAIPLDGAVVISVARMHRLLSVDPDTPCAWVEPGVLNLDLTAAVTHLGLHYAPDPSSQAACSIGGNVGTNAGGPHCFASGVTAQHILGMEIVLPDGEVLAIGGPGARSAGLRPAGVHRRRRGHARHRHEGVRASHPRPPGRSDALGRFHLADGGRRRGARHHRQGRHSGGDGDDGPHDDAGGRGLRARGPAGRRGRRAARRTRRHRRAGWR